MRQYEITASPRTQQIAMQVEGQNGISLFAALHYIDDPILVSRNT
jgi:hypothetical protein